MSKQTDEDMDRSSKDVDRSSKDVDRTSKNIKKKTKANEEKGVETILSPTPITSAAIISHSRHKQKPEGEWADPDKKEKKHHRSSRKKSREHRLGSVSSEHDGEAGEIESTHSILAGGKKGRDKSSKLEIKDDRVIQESDITEDGILRGMSRKKDPSKQKVSTGNNQTSARSSSAGQSSSSSTKTTHSATLSSNSSTAFGKPSSKIELVGKYSMHVARNVSSTTRAFFSRKVDGSNLEDGQIGSSLSLTNAGGTPGQMSKSTAIGFSGIDNLGALGEEREGQRFVAPGEAHLGHDHSVGPTGPGGYGGENLGQGLQQTGSGVYGNEHLGQGLYPTDSTVSWSENLGQGFYTTGSNAQGSENLGQGFYTTGSNAQGSENLGQGFYTTGSSVLGSAYLDHSHEATDVSARGYHGQDPIPAGTMQLMGLGQSMVPEGTMQLMGLGQRMAPEGTIQQMGLGQGLTPAGTMQRMGLGQSLTQAGPHGSATGNVAHGMVDSDEEEDPGDESIDQGVQQAKPEITKDTVAAYLMKHKISDMFDAFLMALLKSKPDKPADFLHEMARKMNMERKLAAAAEPRTPCACERLQKGLVTHEAPDFNSKTSHTRKKKRCQAKKNETPEMMQSNTIEMEIPEMTRPNTKEIEARESMT